MITEQWNVYVLEKENSRKADTLGPTPQAWAHKPVRCTAICCAWKPARKAGPGNPYSHKLQRLRVPRFHREFLTAVKEEEKNHREK